jgi:hypothetical protein
VQLLYTTWVSPQNPDELRQTLLDKWAEIPAERLEHLVVSMFRCLTAINFIQASGVNALY